MIGEVSKLHRRLYGESTTLANIFGFETFPYHGGYDAQS
jgi:hypothetical protein